MPTTTLVHSLTEIKKENFVNELPLIFAFDDDINGDNGLEYVHEDAKALGFNSNAEWIANLTYESHGACESAIKSFVEELIEGDGNYPEYSVQVVETQILFIVSLACILRG